MVAEEWGRAQIIAALKKYTFGHQNISLPYELETGGKDRSPTAELIFDKGVEGSTVFELGCKHGYFCFFAEERGAIRILGVDIDADNIRKSRLLAQMRGSQVAFDRFHIEADAIPDRFDTVLCLNVLHNLRNPIAALEKLIVATRRKLVIELTEYSPHDHKKSSVPFLKKRIPTPKPLLYLEPEQPHNFLISIAAMKVMLLDRRWDFARVDVVRSPNLDGPIVIAHRRQIARLVIVAGVPAIGKTTFIKHLRSPDGREIAKELGIEDATAWSATSTAALIEGDQTELGDIIMHYNIDRYLIYGDGNRHSNGLSDLLSVAGEVKVATMECPRERLVHQYDKRRKPGNETRRGSKRPKRKRIQKRFRDEDQMLSFYASQGLSDLYFEWYRFLEEKGIAAYTVRHDGGDYSMRRTSLSFSVMCSTSDRI